MISLIGIGEAGCNVVSLFESHKEYNCFFFSEGHENTKNFQTLIGEKNNELIKTLSDEIKTFPESLKNI